MSAVPVGPPARRARVVEPPIGEHARDRIENRLVRETGYTGTAAHRIAEMLNEAIGSAEFRARRQGQSSAIRILENIPPGPNAEQQYSNMDVFAIARPQGDHHKVATVMPRRVTQLSGPRELRTDVVDDLSQNPRAQKMMNVRYPGQPYPYGDPHLQQ